MNRTTITVLLAMMAAPAAAQAPVCMGYDRMAALLTDTYGETRQTVGLEKGGSLIETWANLSTGTWTTIVVAAERLACVAVSGEAFQHVEPPPAGIKG